MRSCGTAHWRARTRDDRSANDPRGDRRSAGTAARYRLARTSWSQCPSRSPMHQRTSPVDRNRQREFVAALPVAATLLPGGDEIGTRRGRADAVRCRQRPLVLQHLQGVLCAGDGFGVLTMTQVVSRAVHRCRRHRPASLRQQVRQIGNRPRRGRIARAIGSPSNSSHRKSRAAGDNRDGRPGRGRSHNPASPSARNRLRQR